MFKTSIILNIWMRQIFIDKNKVFDMKYFGIIYFRLVVRTKIKGAVTYAFYLFLEFNASSKRVINSSHNGLYLLSISRL